MPLNTTGRYTWTRSQLRARYRRNTLLIVVGWAAIVLACSVLLGRMFTGGN